MSPDVGTVVSALLATAFWGVWLAWSLRRDRRRLRNGFLLIAVVYTAVGLVNALVALVPGGAEVLSWVALALLVALGLALLALPVLLVVNGLTMVRRERRSFANLLSLVVGVAMLLTPVVVLAPVVLRSVWAMAAATVVLLTTAWLGLVFLGFVAQTLLYRRYAGQVGAHAVIVLGSRVVGGRVPPLLAARLTTAVASAERLGGAGGPVPVVPSGGKGPDEEMPEGAAMATWLTDRGFPAERVLVEDRARTTRENLTYGVGLLQGAGVPGPYLMATNDFHAPRAAMEAMDLGLDVHAVGAPTARYFFPSAYLREFVAVLRRRPAVHVAAAVCIVLAGAVVLYLGR